MTELRTTPGDSRSSSRSADGGACQRSAADFRVGALSAGVLEALAAAVGEMRRGTTLHYPPSDEGRLTDDEIAALSALHLSAAARSALHKIIRAAASAPLFDRFCLLDAVGDPELTRVTPWLPLNFERATADGRRAMMHDDFADSYWQYRERTDHPNR